MTNTLSYFPVVGAGLFVGWLSYYRVLRYIERKRCKKVISRAIQTLDLGKELTAQTASMNKADIVVAVSIRSITTLFSLKEVVDMLATFGKTGAHREIIRRAFLECFDTTLIPELLKAAWWASMKLKMKKYSVEGNYRDYILLWIRPLNPTKKP